MHGINKKEQRRRGDEDDVKHPKSVLGDGEGHVITHLFAARLEGVAGKFLLFILKQIGGYSSKDHDPKDEHEQEPETTKHGWVNLEGVEEPAEKVPLPHVCSTFWALSTDTNKWKLRAAAVLRQTVASNDTKTLKYFQFTSEGGSIGRWMVDEVYAPEQRFQEPKTKNETELLHWEEDTEECDKTIKKNSLDTFQPQEYHMKGSGIHLQILYYLGRNMNLTDRRKFKPAEKTQKKSKRFFP